MPFRSWFLRSPPEGERLMSATIALWHRPFQGGFTASSGMGQGCPSGSSVLCFRTDYDYHF
jgi:hypothetical protein